MTSPSDEIKAKLDIVDLLQEYIKLTQAGANWRARCPFHSEKTPSFMVSREKQIWHCFGCAEGGDIFTFVQKIEGLEFLEALKLLAGKAGVVLKKEDPVLTSQRNRLLDINDLAARFYKEVLQKSQSAQVARDYLTRRGVDQITADDWLLGFSPSGWEETLNFLKKKGYTEQEIFLAGLVVKKDPARGGAGFGNGFYDRFRGRLMFPIRDQHGRVVGFSARTLEVDAKEAKYINTSQTAVFNKGYLLFGLDKAKTEIRKNGLAVLVEGNLDVMTSHQFGVKNVIASCGTALTPEHARLIKRYTDNVALSFDPDTAGQLAAERGIDVALLAGLNVKVIILPPGQDPDKFIRENSVTAWQEKINAAIPVMDFYFSRALDGVDLADVQNKKKAAAKLLPRIAKIVDSVEQHHWLRLLAERLNTPEDILRDLLKKITHKEPLGARAKSSTASVGTSRNQKMAERFFGLLAKDWSRLAYLIQELPPEAMPTGRLQTLYTSLIIYYNKANDLLASDQNAWLAGLSQQMTPDLVDYLNQLTLLLDQEGWELPADKIGGELAEIIVELKRDYINSQLKVIGEQLKKGETLGQTTQVSELAEKFSQLADQLNNLS